MKRNRLKASAALLAMAAGLLSMPAHAGKTLDGVRARGQVVCGVHTGLAGFSAPDASGRWMGLDVDVCRAIAAAVLGDAGKVKYVPLTAQQRFTALQSGEVDVLSRNTTFTLARDASMGLRITAVTYYDGQGFIVPVRSGIRSARQLKNQKVCVQSGTTSERNLNDFSRARGLDIQLVLFEKEDAATSAYFAGRCSAYSTDASGLASIRSRQAAKPADHAILPDLISKEPLGPLVRRGDDEWHAIVTWVIHGLIEAEEHGITQAGVDAMKGGSQDPAVQRLLGATDDTGKMLGLDREWMARALKATGHYGEIFERNVGARSPLALTRGANRLWSQGGLMYAYPMR
ncbi:amino acid ABC transporter substrate-binding protein [Simplicispira lacusdiani]|uniref:amino acid ABC transporter substrate-binding protein n=1 Tax=Simplicispira lacusdiani TaxID=2213010 RepID=UPI000E76E973|nr:amino acid ABC transporter substrate-binding protein [Simplicispira lacusdiani]